MRANISLCLDVWWTHISRLIGKVDARTMYMYDILECFSSLAILVRVIYFKLECVAIDISLLFALHLFDMIMKYLQTLLVDLHLALSSVT